MEFKKMRVKTTTIEQVRGRELPPEWAERAGIDADELIDVVIQPPREQRLKTLFPLIDEIAEGAERQGLTAEKLEELPKEISKYSQATQSLSAHSTNYTLLGESYPGVPETIHR